MAKVDADSCECLRSSLDLFSVPPTDAGISDGRWVEHRPTSAVTGGGPVEFNVSGTGDYYLDLAETLLCVKARLVGEDGTALAEATKTGPVNNFMSSMCSQVDVSLNGKVVSSSTNTYTYRAYVETLLSYGDDAKSSHMQASLWYKDTKGKMSDVADLNTGLVARRKLTVASKEVDMMGKLHVDVFKQKQYLLNDVDLRIRLVRSKDAFCLMAPAGEGAVKLEVTDAYLLVRKVKPNTALQLAYARELESRPAKYTITRVDTRVFSIAQGSRSVSKEDVFQGRIPKRLVIGCVTNKALNGHYQANPYDFQHFKANFVGVYADGQQLLGKPLQPDFTKGLYVRAFHSMTAGIGKFDADEGNSVTREDYLAGYALYAFNLTPDLSEGDFLSLQKQGSLRIEIHFGEALQESVDVFAYAEFDNVIQIDKNRNVVYDHSV
jgi:hypothetical protein